MSSNAKTMRKAQTLCGKKFRNREDRLEFASAFCGYEVQSFKELTTEQLEDLIFYMSTGHRPDDARWAKFDHGNKQHRTILALCHERGWTTHHPKHGQVVNLEVLGKWLKGKRCPVRKPLMAMTGRELSKIISALESMNKKDYQY